MPTALDIFNTDAFSVVEMTKAINSTPFKPMRIQQMGLFQEEGITTTSVGIELNDETFTLVPDSPRGGIPDPVALEKRKMIQIKVPHLPQVGAVYADSVQNVRAFGAVDNALETAQNAVNRVLTKMRQRLDLTIEYHRIGALKGQVLDYDGATVLYNLYTLFGVSQQLHDMKLDTATTNPMAEAMAITAKIEDALGGLSYDHIHAFCGASFFSKLIAHALVKETFLGWQRAQRFLEDDFRFGGFVMGNIIWEQYRGKVGAIDYIPTAKAYVFPVGVPDMFLTNYAPADYVETVNTVGLPYYSKQEQKRLGKGIDIEAQSNPLNVNTRPRAVIEVDEDVA